jgi:hypothetical protein
MIGSPHNLEDAGMLTKAIKPESLLLYPFFSKKLTGKDPCEEDKTISAEIWKEPFLLAVTNDENRPESPLLDPSENDLYEIVNAEGSSDFCSEVILRHERSFRRPRRKKEMRVNWRASLRETIQQKSKKGAPIICFYQGFKTRMRWHEHPYGRREVCEGRTTYNDSRIFLGIVMPLSTAETLPLKNTKGQNELRRIVNKHVQSLCCAIPPDALNTKIFDPWPVVLTFDRHVIALRQNDNVTNIRGDIVYKLIAHRVRTTPSRGNNSYLETYTPHHIFYSYRDREIYDIEGWTDKVAYGWPASPLTAILRGNTMDPVQTNRIERILEKAESSGLLELLCEPHTRLQHNNSKRPKRKITVPFAHSVFGL